MQENIHSDDVYIDPVCFMKVAPQNDLKCIHNLRSYYFCAEACKNAFKEDPERYLNFKKGPKRKGLWGRYLDRLNKATKGKSMECH